MIRLLWATGAVLSVVALCFMSVLVLGSAPGPARADDPAGSQRPAGSENSSVFLFNAGTAEANIVLSYYDPNGVYRSGDACPGGTTASQNVCSGALSPGQSTRFDQFYNEGLERPYRGSGTLAADQPTHALVIKNIEDESAGDPATLSYSIENAPTTAYRRLYLPLLTKDVEGWRTRFTIQNTSDNEPACVRFSYFDANGRRSVSPPRGTIPARGRCPAGGWSILPLGTKVVTGGSRLMLVPRGFSGAVVVESLPNADAGRPALVAEVDRFRAGGREFGSYTARGITVSPAGVLRLGDPTDDLSRKAYVALIQRKALDGVGPPWSTRVAIVAAEPEQPVKVSAVYVGTGASKGTRRTCRISITGAGDDSACRLPDGFTGYAVFRSRSPIALVWEREQEAAGALSRYAIVEGQPGGSAVTRVDLPLMVSDYWTGWTSRARILSLDGTAPILDLELIPKQRDSCITGTRLKRVRPLEAAFTLNFAARGYYSPWPNGNPGGCFYGALRITADRPIAVVGSLTLLGFRGDIEASYRGLPHP